MTRKTAEHPAAVIFRKRAKSIYAGMKRRAAKDRVVLPFTFSDFDEWLRSQMWPAHLENPGVTRCGYSNQILTAENFFVDHDWPISRHGAWNLGNLVLCTEKENLCKGELMGDEWIRLRNYISTMDPVPRESIMRRLAVGDVQRFSHFRRQRKRRSDG